MSKSIWDNHLIKWRDRATWSPLLMQFIQPHLVGDLRSIRSEALTVSSDIRYESERWLDMLLDYQTAEVTAYLSEAIRPARMQLFHATRTEDASRFHAEGLHAVPRKRLVEQAKAIIIKSPRLQPLLAYTDSDRSGIQRSRDRGAIYTCTDDRPLTEDDTHYALYGSEWILAHLVNLASNTTVGVTPSDVCDALREHGVPTILEIDLPLKLLDDYERLILVRDEFLPELVAELLLDDTDTPVGRGCPIIRKKIPSKSIVGHFHPAVLKDSHSRLIPRSGWPTTCPYCFRSQTSE